MQLLIIVHRLALIPQVLLGGIDGPLAVDFDLEVADGVSALDRQGKLPALVLDGDAQGHGCVLWCWRKFEGVEGGVVRVDGGVGG